MRHSPLNPPPELLAALNSVVAGMIAVRAQIHSLQAAESLLLQTGDMLARQLAAAGSASKPTDSALNMADLTAHLPAPYAYGIKDRLNQMAHSALDGRLRTAAHERRPRRQRRRSRAGDRAGAAANARSSRPADIRVSTVTTVTGVRVQPRGSAGIRPDGGKTTVSERAESQALGQRLESSADLFDSLVGDLGQEFDGLRNDSPGIDEAPRGAEPRCAVPHGLATLEGYGPISDQDAADFAAQATCWEKVTVDAETGTVLTVDTYRPSAAQRRFLGARDLHCRFPGCRATLAWCGVDHTIDAALGGPASSSNLGHLCRRHHSLKHATPWTVEQHKNGVFIWVSPTGRQYTDTPESNVRFRERDEHEGTAAPRSGPTGTIVPESRKVETGRSALPGVTAPYGVTAPSGATAPPAFGRAEKRVPTPDESGFGAGLEPRKDSALRKGESSASDNVGQIPF